MSRHSIRSLWRAAAWLALLAFVGLPQGHLRGHEQVAAARAHADVAPAALTPAPPGEADSRHQACPICLSLARVKDGIAQAGGIELPLLAAGAPPAPPPRPFVPAAPASAHTAPRAPPQA